MAAPVAWPSAVVELMRSASFAQYATMSSAGVPIDTPVLFFPSEGLASFDLTTGLSYPAKAERARRNPRTSLLIEGGSDEPVVLISGLAAVRDADLQSNVLRYLAEAGHTLPHNPPWELARQATWYWTRILVQITPSRVLWWDSPSQMNSAPHRWNAPEGALYPPSDPAPSGAGSQPAAWEQPLPWRELAQRALARNAPGYLSLVDAEHFPFCVRATSIELGPEGILLKIPSGLPVRAEGKSSLTFGGIETFIGEMVQPNMMRVDRTLPILPMTADMTQLWQPTSHTREELMKRLVEETRRRGQAIPFIPLVPPEPTAGYKLRIARLKSR